MTEENQTNWLRPLEFYNNFLKKDFSDRVEKEFQDLLDQSGVDPGANQVEVKKYHELEKKAKAANRAKARAQGLNIFLLVLIIISAIFSAIEIYRYYDLRVKDLILYICIGLAVMVLVIVLKQTKMKEFLAKKEKKLKEAEDAAQAQSQVCWDQMAPLNALFEEATTSKLISQTMPILNLDPYFKPDRLGQLVDLYNFRDLDEVGSASTLQLLSGEIHGNPFVFFRKLIREIRPCRYEGTKVIHWTEQAYDSSGNSRTIHHTQVLHAYVDKPKPYYSKEVSMAYGNDAAPRLNFSREPGHVEELSERELKKKLKKDGKALKKKAEKAVTKGGSFTTMANVKFESLFNALDRDNETEFRLLFTPLAQENMLNLLLKSPYGDDFRFKKRKKMNLVEPEHTADWDMDTRDYKFVNYDLEEAKKNFYQVNTEYFKHFYFTMAPILAIPLYQNHKAQSYIYGENDRNYTPYANEVLVNQMEKADFAHPESSTSPILHSNFIGAKGKTDFYQVQAYSYKGEDRVDYVTVFGRDGYFHEVPVPWVEYIPLEQDSYVGTRDIGMGELDYDQMVTGKAFQDFSQEYGEDMAFQRGLFSMKLKPEKVEKMIDGEGQASSASKSLEDAFDQLVKVFKKEASNG